MHFPRILAFCKIDVRFILNFVFLEFTKAKKSKVMKRIMSIHTVGID